MTQWEKSPKKQSEGVRFCQKFVLEKKGIYVLKLLNKLNYEQFEFTSFCSGEKL